MLDSAHTHRLNDERGALSLAGLLMATLLVAMLYATLGVSETLTAKEGMQDAADAAAYSSAVMHARGMNLIAFINMLMAALISVLIAIRLAQTALLAIAGGLWAFAWAGGVTASLATPITHGAVKMGKVYKQAKKFVNPALKRLHQVQEATQMIVPYVALADGAYEAAAHHDPALGAIALPGAMSLPVEVDKFPVLCERGAEFAARTALDLAFFPVPGVSGDDIPGAIIEPIESSIGDLAHSTSGYLCGAGKSPPKHTQREELSLPRPAGLDSCKESPDSASCRDAQAELRRAKESRGRRGQCLHGCGYTQPFERLARRARSACDPSRNRGLRNFTWQEQEVEVTWTFLRGVWQMTDERDLGPPRVREETSRPPCGRGGTLNSEEWNLDSGPPSQKVPTALCGEELPPPPGAPREGTTSKLKTLRAVRLFSCVQSITTEYNLAKKEDKVAGGKKRSPHRMEKDLELGEEAFLIRALALGRGVGPSDTSRAGVDLSALYRQTEEEASEFSRAADELSDTAAQLMEFSGNVAIAQTEYFFDHGGNVDAKDWLWDMRWTARLSRFSLPNDEEESTENERQKKNEKGEKDRLSELGLEDLGSKEDPCSGIEVEGCESAEETSELFNRFVIH